MIIMRYNNVLEVEILDVDTYFSDNERELATLAVGPSMQDPNSGDYLKTVMFRDKNAGRQGLVVIGHYKIVKNTDDIGLVKEHFYEIIKHPLMKAVKRTVELDKFNF